MHPRDTPTQNPEPATTRVPVVEEQARIEKRAVASARVQVRTHVEEHREVLREQLIGQVLDITNVAVEREVQAAPPPRQEGDVTIVSLVEERMVVTRKLFVVEELHIRRSTRLDDVSVPVTLRTMRAVVEEDNIIKEPEGPPSRPASGST